MGRLGRFLKLERVREADDGEARAAGSRSRRFEAEAADTAGELEGDGAAPASPSGAADRFAPPPELTSGPLDVDTSDDERPQTRCLECGIESGKFCDRCPSCGADLRNRAVVRLNRRLWVEERRQRAAARTERSSRSAAEAEALATAARSRREDAERAAITAFDRILGEERARRGAPIARLVAALDRWPRLDGGWRRAVAIAVAIVIVVALGRGGGRAGTLAQVAIAAALVWSLRRR